ncbi:CAP domain-containing protein [Streptomyces sp. NBC_00487]
MIPRPVCGATRSPTTTSLPSNACVNGRECLHYTQLVWRTSTRVGAAGARCGNAGPTWWPTSIRRGTGSADGRTDRRSRGSRETPQGP